MKLEKITRKDCKTLRHALTSELADLGKKHGLIIKAGSASYTDNSVTFKVECLIAGFDQAKDNFERHAFMFDLTDDQFGAFFRYGKRTYKLVGLKPRSPKYPIIGEHDGSRYKLPEKAVASLLSSGSK